jgi:hypothetical protein
VPAADRSGDHRDEQQHPQDADDAARPQTLRQGVTVEFSA